MTAARKQQLHIAMIGTKGMPASWGGVEQHVHHLALQQLRLGNTVTVYSRAHYTSREDAADLMASNPGLNIIFVPTIKTKHLDAIVSTLFATLHAMLIARPQVYHFHSVGPSLLSFLPRVFARRSHTVVTFHSPDRQHAKWGRFAKFILTFGEWTSLHFPHSTITVSNDLHQYALDTYGVDTTMIPNGVELPVLTTHQASEQFESQKQLLAQFGLEPQQYAMIVARLVPHKGIHLAIDAWKCMSTPKKLVIVGDAVLGTEEYVAELREHAANDERILFTGFQSGEILDALYRHAYVTLHPSHSEGLSISLLESASYSKGMIASDIPANLEIVEHGGFAFEEGNIDEFIATIEYTLQNPHAVKVAGRAAREHIAANYQWNTIAERTHAVYHHGNPAIESRFHEQAPIAIR